MDGVPEALDSDKLYAGHEQRSSRSWRSSRQASSEALAAAGAWGRRSSQPASREAQRPAKLAASEKETLWCMSHLQSIYKLEHEQGL